MKKIILFAIFLICACVVKAQNPTGVPQLFNGKWYKYSQFVEIDSALLVSNKDTNWLPRQPSLVFWQHASVDTAFWVYNGRRWNKIGNYIDTASMLSPYLKKSDTATMLLPYLRKVDTLSLSNRINGKVDKTTTITINGVTYDLSANRTWTIAGVDTTSLSNRINLKLNISDTSSMLIPYLRKGDTTSLSNRINLKQNLLTLTTTGSSGASTLTGATLNIPNYSGALTGYVPYVGATTNVDLGTNNLTGAQVKVNSGINLKNSGSPTMPYESGYTGITAFENNFTFYNFYGNKGADFYYAGGGVGIKTYNLPIRSGTLALVEDTVSLSNRINLKADKSTTLTINGTGYDLSANRSWTVAGTDTTSLSNRINLKLNISDTASMLSPYLRKADTSSLSNRINLKQNLLSLTTTGTSGASTLVGSTLNIPQYQGIITNPITGTGTVNTVPKFTGTGTSIGDSHIKDDGNVVTVNTTAGSFGALQVGNYNGNILMNTNSTNAALTFQNTVSSNKLWDLSTPGNDLAIDESNTLPAPPRMYFKAGGHVLINSSTDDASGGQLQVTGSIQQSVTSSMLKASSTGIISAATVGTDYGTVTSVGLSMPVAFSVANSPITSTGTLAVTAVGTAAQYIRGDGQLATLPSGSSGGSSVDYYLNGGTSQGTIGGSTYYEMSKDAVIGTGVDFSRTNAQGNGLISQFITDANDPNRTEIPAGAWNFEMFFSASSSGGSPSYYIELLKYDGTNFTSIASGVANPELITSGTTIDLYLTSLAVPYTTLLITDRLVVRIYVVTSGKTITLHTQNGHLCLVTTSFAGGVTSINGLNANTQYLAVGTAGTDFAINSLTDTHTFNLPTASATNRGALSSANWSTFNGKMNYSDTTSLSNRINLKLNSSDTASLSNRINAKQNTLTLTTTGTSGASTLTGATLNIPQYQAAGTYVTSVTGTSPIVSSGGTTPAISIPAATSSVNGYLTSTDWTAFNGKQNAINGTGFVKASGTTISYDNSSYYLASNPSGYTTNTGTVTSIATNLGLTGGTITTSGTLSVDTASASILSRQRAAATYLVPSSLSGYVPYTGATTNVTLGAHTLQSGGDPTSDVNGVLLSNAGTVDTRISSTVANSYNFNASRSANGSGYVLSRNGYHKANIGVIGGGGSNTNDGVMTFGSYYQASSGSGINDGAFTELMRLNPSGVGNATLDVTGSGKFSSNITSLISIAGVQNQLILENTNTTSGADGSSIYFKGFQGSLAKISAYGYPQDEVGGYLQLQSYSDNTTANTGLIITKGGNVGIGTTSPNVAGVSKALTIDGSINSILELNYGGGTRGGYLFSNSANTVLSSVQSAPLLFNTNDITRLAITSSGNVGIGTTSPRTNTEIFTTGNSFTSSTFTFNSSTTKGLLLSNSAGTNQSGNAIWFDNSGLYSAIASTRESTGDWGTDIRFFTHPTTIANQFDVTERMRITSGGNTLIGTTTDNGAKLQVSGGVTAQSGVIQNTTGNNSSLTIYRGSSQTYGAKINALDNDGSVSFESIGDNSNPNMYFRLRTLGTTITPLTLSGSGAATFSSSVTATDLYAKSGSTGYVSMRSGNASVSGYLEFYKGDGATRLGYLGYSNTDIALTLENSAKYTINGGNVGIGTTSPNELLDVRNSYREPTSGEFTQILSSTTTQDAGRGGSLGFGGFTNGTSGYTTFSGIKGFKENGDGGNTAGTLAFYTRVNSGAMTERMRINNSGAVTINNLGTGTVYSNGGTLTNTNPSDSSLKNSIEPLSYGLNEIMQLKPKTFYYNSDSTKSNLKYGFIAQEVQPIMPNIVRAIGNGSDKLGLESDGINVAMVNAIQELKKEIETLKAEIQKLKK